MQHLKAEGQPACPREGEPPEVEVFRNRHHPAQAPAASAVGAPSHSPGRQPWVPGHPLPEQAPAGAA
jgi:hypothetical protein